MMKASEPEVTMKSELQAELQINLNIITDNTESKNIIKNKVSGLSAIKLSIGS